MGKIGNDKGTFSIPYTDEFMSIYRDQSPEFIKIMNEYGKPYGYTAQNVFFFFLIRYVIELYGEVTIPDYPRAL